MSARLVLFALLAVLAPSLRAAEGGFVATLSSEARTAAGLPELSAAERAALDRLVAQDVASAREQNITEFSSGFVSRLTDEERKAAGLDRLTPAQLTRLNGLIASALAARPKPKERPRLKESEVLAEARKPEIHGSITLAYGWGGGGTFRGGSLWLDYYDPENHFGLGIGLSNITGNGYFGYGPGAYRYGPRYSRALPVSYDVSERDGPDEAFIRGEGQSFARDAGGWGGHRGH
ncbi:MAG: hypothetical protein JWQ62_1124 [Lacunisphaera sp.]|nr:hypothetical protein [Lacunisphaera sp.]